MNGNDDYIPQPPPHDVWRIKRVTAGGINMSGGGGKTTTKKKTSATLPRTTYKSAFDPDKKVDSATCGVAVSA